VGIDVGPFGNEITFTRPAARNSHGLAYEQEINEKEPTNRSRASSEANANGLLDAATFNNQKEVTKSTQQSNTQAVDADSFNRAYNDLKGIEEEDASSSVGLDSEQQEADRTESKALRSSTVNEPLLNDSKSEMDARNLRTILTEATPLERSAQSDEGDPFKKSITLPPLDFENYRNIINDDEILGKSGVDAGSSNIYAGFSSSEFFGAEKEKTLKSEKSEDGSTNSEKDLNYLRGILNEILSNKSFVEGGTDDPKKFLNEPNDNNNLRNIINEALMNKSITINNVHIIQNNLIDEQKLGNIKEIISDILKNKTDIQSRQPAAPQQQQTKNKTATQKLSTQMSTGSTISVSSGGDGGGGNGSGTDGVIIDGIDQTTNLRNIANEAFVARSFANNKNTDANEHTLTFASSFKSEPMISSSSDEAEEDEEELEKNGITNLRTIISEVLDVNSKSNKSITNNEEFKAIEQELIEMNSGMNNLRQIFSEALIAASKFSYSDETHDYKWANIAEGLADDNSVLTRAPSDSNQQDIGRSFNLKRPLQKNESLISSASDDSLNIVQSNEYLVDPFDSIVGKRTSSILEDNQLKFMLHGDSNKVNNKADLELIRLSSSSNENLVDQNARNKAVKKTNVITVGTEPFELIDFGKEFDLVEGLNLNKPINQINQSIATKTKPDFDVKASLSSLESIPKVKAPLGFSNEDKLDNTNDTNVEKSNNEGNFEDDDDANDDDDDDYDSSDSSIDFNKGNYKQAVKVGSSSPHQLIELDKIDQRNQNYLIDDFKDNMSIVSDEYDAFKRIDSNTFKNLKVNTANNKSDSHFSDSIQSRSNTLDSQKRKNEPMSIDSMEPKSNAPNNRSNKSSSSSLSVLDKNENFATNKLNEPVLSIIYLFYFLSFNFTYTYLKFIKLLFLIYFEAQAPKPRVCTIMPDPSFEGLGIHLSGSKNHMIKHIEANSPAHLGGLKPGDKILYINNENVEKSDHTVIIQMLKEALKKNEQIELIVMNTIEYNLFNSNKSK
jgi:hypothetical protein